MQKDLDLQKMSFQKATMEKDNLLKQIDSMKVQHSNELKLVKNKAEREFEQQLEDEKHAMQLQSDQFRKKAKEYADKVQHLQALLKKQKNQNDLQFKFCA